MSEPFTEGNELVQRANNMNNASLDTPYNIVTLMIYNIFTLIGTEDEKTGVNKHKNVIDLKKKIDDHTKKLSNILSSLFPGHVSNEPVQGYKVLSEPGTYAILEESFTGSSSRVCIEPHNVVVSCFSTNLDTLTSFLDAFHFESQIQELVKNMVEEHDITDVNQTREGKPYGLRSLINAEHCDVVQKCLTLLRRPVEDIKDLFPTCGTPSSGKRKREN